MSDIADTINALSQRQKQILQLLNQNMQAKEIARELGISEHTVKTHTETIRKRLNVTTSREAARLFGQYESNFAIPREEGGSPRPIEGPALFVSQRAQSLGGPGASEATGRHFGESVPKMRALSDLESARGLVGLSFKLKSLSTVKWLFLILAISISSALLMGGLITATLSTLEAFNRLGKTLH